MEPQTTEKQWQPSNSADGIFMENICCNCQHDAAFQAGTGDSCEIAAAMYRNMGDPSWVIGKDGPRCKQFKALDDASYRCEETPDMFSSSAIGAAHPSTLEDLGEQHDS